MSNEITSVNKSQKVASKVNTIPLKEARKWAKRWAKKEGNYNKHHHVHAFLIPKVDLLEVLDEGIDAVRAYIGVDDEGVEKLMIVGTKYDLATGIYVDLISGDDAKAADAIYDVTLPCPPACDANSPMMQ